MDIARFLLCVRGHLVIRIFFVSLFVILLFNFRVDHHHLHHHHHLQPVRSLRRYVAPRSAHSLFLLLVLLLLLLN